MKSGIFVLLLFITSVSTNGQLANYSEEIFKKNFIERLEILDPLEGIWNVTATTETYHFDTLFNVQQSPEALKIAIVKQDNKFFTYRMSGEVFETEFNSTDVKSVYLYRNYFPSISSYSKKQAVICKTGQMEYTYDFPQEYLIQKMGDKYFEGLRMVSIMKWNKIFPSPNSQTK